MDNILTLDDNGLIAITLLETDGDVGNIEVTRLFNANIGGDVTGHIYLTPNTGTSPRSGYMEDCVVIGDILGDVIVITEPSDGAGQLGTIDNLRIDGTLGSVSASTILGVDGLLRDVQIGSLRSHITSSTLGAVVQIDDLLVVTSTGEDGKLHGEILVENIDQVSGDPSSLSFAGGIASTGRVRIAQELLSGDGEIILPTNGLVGQIIIGADGSTGTWTGPVDVGSTTLAPVYSNTASSLGGGSVGRVPFEAHRTDSVPALNSNLTFTTSAVTPSYDIRHYGPVTFDDQATPLMPIRIEKRSLAGSTWLDVTSEWAFDYAVSSTNDTIIDMDAQQSANYRNGFEYRFVAETNPAADDVLLSDLGFVSNPTVGAYPTDAWFTVGSECPWDIDNSCMTDIDDMNVVLSGWDGTGNNLAADVNGSGTVDIDDLNLILSNWDEACAGCSLGLLGGGEDEGGGSAGDLLVGELGYASVEAFCAAFEEMDAEGQSVLLAALVAAAGE